MRCHSYFWLLLSIRVHRCHASLAREELGGGSILGFSFDGEIVDDSNLRDDIDALAVRRYEQSLEPADHYNLGNMYLHGRGVKLGQSHEEAHRWFLTAAEAGHAEAAFNLANLYRLRQGIPPMAKAESDSTAVRWYRAAAEAGLGKACMNLGNMYSLGLGTDKGPSPPDHVYWYQRGSDADHVPSLRALAAMTRDGYGGLEKDEEAALALEKRAVFAEALSATQEMAVK